MGTRSLTFTYINSEKIICLYRQYDGYPEGHGKELATILSTTLSNGMECLSASIVAKLKTGAYNIYLYPTSVKDAWQEYEYHVYEEEVEVIKTYPERHSIFAGSYSEFMNFCNALQGETA
jgi:hypothetical protein